MQNTAEEQLNTVIVPVETRGAKAAEMLDYERQFEGEKLTGIDDRLAYRFMKRTFDIVFSAVMLVAFCWVFAIIAILIKADDPKGPVVFRQDRVGKNGKIFRMHKLRSMCVDAEAKLEDLRKFNEKTGPVFKMKKDPRVTRVGYWLRKLSLVPVIIGTPGDGEPTKSYSRPVNSSLDLQICELRPGTSLGACSHYASFLFLPGAVFRGQISILKCVSRTSDVVSDGRVHAVVRTAREAAPLANDRTVAA